MRIGGIGRFRVVMQEGEKVEGGRAFSIGLACVRVPLTIMYGASFIRIRETDLCYNVK